MAITRLHQCGFETGKIDECAYTGVGVPVIMPSIKYTGAYSGAIDQQDNPRYFSFPVPATNQVRFGYFFYTTYFGSATYGGSFGGAMTAASALVSAIGWSTGAVKIGNNFDVYANGGWQGQTVNSPLRLSKWMHIGCDIKIDAAAGWVKVWIDGVLKYNYTGNTGTDQIEKVCIGSPSSPWWNGGIYGYYDDIYVEDTTGESASTSVPVQRFKSLLITGAGNYAQFDPSVGSNYECVDERPPSDTDYVSTSVVDEFDSYAMDTFTLDTNETITSIIPIIRAKRGETTEEVAIGTRYSSTDVVGSGLVPAVGTFSFLSERQTTKPGGGAWDQTSMDGVEALIKSRGTY